jgi:hypothetical protein
LVKAIYMVDGQNVKVVNWLDTVEYFHLMLDKHELLHCDGTISESWQPHMRNLLRDDETRHELLAIFPEIATKDSDNDGGWVRQEIAPAHVQLISS